ncbi:hypothetical protein SAMN02910456_00836 [Ruminococcaceae bacterium YRB3002]|nr:hypothetical protein SAMN02910456_00836 [Ruminococcaceae bacterium YRB3002]
MDNENRTGTDSMEATKILGTDPAAPAVIKQVKNAGNTTPSGTTPDSYATLSMVFGILSIVGGFSGIMSLVFGILGLIFSNNAKKLGYDDTIRKVGFWTSLAGVIISGMSFAAIMAVLLIFGFGMIASFISVFLGIIAAAMRGILAIL